MARSCSGWNDASILRQDGQQIQTARGANAPWWLAGYKPGAGAARIAAAAQLNRGRSIPASREDARQYGGQVGRALRRVQLYGFDEARFAQPRAR